MKLPKLKRWQWIAISIIVIMILLNPGLARFKEYAGLPPNDYGDVQRKADFIVCSLYQYGNTKYVGLLHNFIEVHPFDFPIHFNSGSEKSETKPHYNFVSPMDTSASRGYISPLDTLLYSNGVIKRTGKKITMDQIMKISLLGEVKSDSDVIKILYSNSNPIKSHNNIAEISDEFAKEFKLKKKK